MESTIDRERIANCSFNTSYLSHKYVRYVVICPLKCDGVILFPVVKRL